MKHTTPPALRPVPATEAPSPIRRDSVFRSAVRAARSSAWTAVAVLLLGLGFTQPGALQAQDPLTEDVIQGGPKREGEPELKDLPAEVKVNSAKVRPADKAGKPGHRYVRGIERVRKNTGRIDWSLQGDWIAFDAKGSDELYDLYVGKADGSKERCLTCENFDFRKVNVLNPVWHPSGNLLVVQVQENARKLKLNPAQLATPFQGLHSDLWVISADGRFSFQITKIREQGGAVLDPFFSFEADRLIWSERITNKNEPWGDWGVRVVGFKYKRGVPRLGAIKTYPSGGWRGYRAASALAPNDRSILVTASLPAASFEQGLDIFQVSLEDGTLEPLTQAPDLRDEKAQYSPKSDHIVWASNRGIDRPKSGAVPWRTDLWIMPAEVNPGLRRSQERLTYFNHPDADEYLGEALISDYAWSPAGDELLLHVVYRRPGGEDVEEALYKVSLAPSFRR